MTHRALAAILCLSLSTGAAAAEPARVALDPRADPADLPTGAVCSTGRIRCTAHVHTTGAGAIRAQAAPAGFSPADLQAAYDIPTEIAGSPTIAIIDAYGYPQLEADLALYRSTFGLPPCTVASGCLRIVNQRGATSPLPPAAPVNDDWTLETALDVDSASAACPRCKLLVIQTDDTGDGLFIANNTAAALGATVISNSWGFAETGPLGAYEPYFDHPGIAIFASSGDRGYNYGGAGPLYPATSAHVIAVGGTRLVKDASARGWTETSWATSGSACSLSIPKPAYQTTSPCPFKATSDLALVGDPQTGVAVYNARNGGWLVVGGTSASAPLAAAIFAATGHGSATSAFIASIAPMLNDVVAGQNGTCGNALCNAAPGWDGPTGYGTPNARRLMPPGSTPPGGGGGDPGNGGDGDDGGGDLTGGCTTGGSGTSWLVVLGIGWLCRRRRAG